MNESLPIGESMNFEKYIDVLIPIIADANKAIMAIYGNPGATTVDLKDDASPVTNADHAAHHILLAGLTKLTPDIPVVSEEGDLAANQHNIQSNAFWVVDPLDGTKEFIKQNGQFTVCVALVINGKPVLGVVAAPALSEIYYGGYGIGSYVIHADGAKSVLHVAAEPTGVVYGSISHPNNETSEYIAANFAAAKIEECGSQLKFMKIAAGLGDAYPRLSTTMRIWDVAAGHAIVEGAGGTVTRPDGAPITYESPDFYIGDFVASR